MASTPRKTVSTRRLPKVGDEISIRVKVTRVAGDKGDEQITVRLPGNGQLATARAEYLLADDES